MTSRVKNEDEKLARLQALPVSGRETRRIPATKAPRIGFAFIDRRGRLLTVIASEYKGRITEDDPSIYGEQLLGCEGQQSYDVSYEIRQEPAPCPAS